MSRSLDIQAEINSTETISLDSETVICWYCGKPAIREVCVENQESIVWYHHDCENAKIESKIKLERRRLAQNEDLLVQDIDAVNRAIFLHELKNLKLKYKDIINKYGWRNLNET